MSDDVIDEEMKSVTEHRENVEHVLFEIRSRLDALSISSSGLGAAVPQISSNPVTCRLPTLELEKFSGDQSEWMGWWTMFREAVDSQNCSDSLKFVHLQQCVTGEAKECI